MTFIVSLLIAGLIFVAQTGRPAAGPVGSATADRGEDWLIPSPIAGVMMHARVFRPASDGRFPLAVVSHGSEESARLRRRRGRPDFPRLTELLLAAGYAVVVPERPGHGATGGEYLESQGPCHAPDYLAAGRGAALSIDATIQFMRRQPFVGEGPVLLVGNSAGSWGSLVAAALSGDDIGAVVNFAGGRGGRDRNRPGRNCAPEQLVAATATIGAASKVPTLWFYAENDSYFSAELSTRMAAAYAEAGGTVEYHLFGAVEGDGHRLIFSDPEQVGWGPVLRSFLRRFGR